MGQDQDPRNRAWGSSAVKISFTIALAAFILAAAVFGDIMGWWNIPTTQKAKKPPVIIKISPPVVKIKKPACSKGNSLRSLNGVGYTSANSLRVQKPRKHARKWQKTFYLNVNSAYHRRPCDGAWLKVQRTRHGGYIAWVPHHYGVDRIREHQLSSKFYLVCKVVRY